MNDQEQVRYITRDKTALTVGGNRDRFLRLGTTMGSLDTLKMNLQVGSPYLPEPGSSTQCALLRAWLHRCDESHGCWSATGATTPSRLLDVGTANTSTLRLCCSNENETPKYLALSHCWGEVSKEKQRQFCTTNENIEARLNGFDVSELPKTFRDAVRVAQNLDIRYLWIDSLCIIQGNQEDWKHESKRMQDVYAGAYCTIAATSAVDSNAGFLERTVRSECIHIQDTSGRQFYVCTEVDDFNNDVENALLNKRAWVLQERVLSRRTMHFSANQVYFECGDGVYCETLTTLECLPRRKFFMLDPKFPQRLLKAGDRRTVEFIQFLFTEYSRRGLTEKTDRCAAISGLQNCIAQVKGETIFGVLQSSLHRFLLWQRSEERNTDRIGYETQIVPSWSWMAYSGSIQFMDIAFEQVEWVRSLRFSQENEHRALNEKGQPALVTDISSFLGCSLKQRDLGYTVLELDGAEKGWIQYDMGTHERLDAERCVVVGRDDWEIDAGKRKYYILVVTPTSMENEYTRVGTGWVLSGHVARQGVQALIV